MNNIWFYISIACICLAAVSIVLVLIKAKQNYKTAGTMYIDMNRDDKDICRFVLGMPLNEIAQEKYVIVVVKGTLNLKEWPK